MLSIKGVPYRDMMGCWYVDNIQPTQVNLMHDCKLQNCRFESILNVVCLLGLHCFESSMLCAV